MSYIFRGSLCGYLCSDCSEPLHGIKVRLYRTDGVRESAAMAAANADDTFHPLSKEEVESKRSRLIAETTVDAKGDYEFKLSGEENYDGNAFEVDIWCPTGYRKPIPPRGDEGLQFHVTTLQPFWRESRAEREQARFYYWKYCIPSKWWCRILALLDLWVVCGQVTHCDNGIAIAGVKVQAFDADWLRHDPLGSAVTDSGGHFTIYYSRADFEKTLFSWVSLEWVSGPDLYFRIESGSGVELLKEDPSAGRARGRQNVGNCFCVKLCVRADVPPHEILPVPEFNRIGLVDYTTDMRSDVSQDGLTNDEYAFYGGLRLNGVLARSIGGQPMEYRFEYTNEYDINGEPENWKPVLPTQIGTTHIGFIQKAVLVTPPAPALPFYKYKDTQCYVNNAPIAGAFVTTPDAQGWILVPQQHDDPSNLAGVGLFTASTGNQIVLDSTTLMPSTTIDLTGLVAGEDYTVTTGKPLAEDEIFAVQMVVRQQGNDSTRQVAGTCKRLALDNTGYSGMIHHPSWSKWGPTTEAGVCMIDIQQLIEKGCAKITEQVDILYTVAHPHLNSISLLLEGPMPDMFIGSFAPVDENNFGVVTHSFAPTDPECAYLVTLSTTYLLTDGDSKGITGKDYMAFCR